MRRDQDTQSIESSIDHETTGSAHSRRGFLRKAGATGILGMTGIALATESVSAGEADEDNRSSHGDSVVVTGFGSGRNYYEFHTTGDIDHMEHPRHKKAEDGDENLTLSGESRDGIRGEVWGGNKDRFAYNGQISYVSVVGTASLNVDFSAVSD